jgi:DNA-binding winged helix-turn-helix (wHTH) protein
MEPAQGQPRIVRFGAFEVDLESGELRKFGMRQKLAGQAFDVLRFLLERPQEIVTREELRNRIWPSDTYVDYDLALKKAVSRVRGVLGDSAETPRFIETIPRRGYRFIGVVEPRRPPAGESDLPATAVNAAVPAIATAAVRGRKTPWFVAGFVLTALVVLKVLVWEGWPIRRSKGTSAMQESDLGRQPDFQVPDSEPSEDVDYVLSYGTVHGPRFYESGWGEIPRTERFYATTFDGSVARYVNWELHLTFPEAGRTATFGVKAVYTRAEAEAVYTQGRNLRIAVQNRPCRLDAGTSETWCTYGWGSNNPGGWDPGPYRVELFIGGKKIAEGKFDIT